MPWGDDERVHAHLRTLEIDVSQARALFSLFDVDESGEVAIEEFVEGCMQVRGGATGTDINVLMF